MNTKFTRSMGNLSVKFKRNSPNIYFGVGLAGVVTGGVLACRATLKLEKEVDKINENMKTLKYAEENDVETDESIDSLKAAVFIKGGLSIAKLYAPAIIVTSAGLTALTASHVQLTRRNASLQAALIAVTQAYDDYRERIRREIGDEKEEKIFRNLDGIAAKDAPLDRDPNKFSVYARCFDEYNVNWVKDPELNRIFVQCQQNYANHKLQARGHLFLNEVYSSLGFEHSSAGAIMGWVLNGDGDNYVDFGIYEMRNSNFVNGEERSAWLDFNVDGVIFDKI
jgi:hypothetical protein